jgi:heme-degrading monooxygenase HmoA
MLFGKYALPSREHLGNEGGSMFASVSTYQGSPDQIDEGVRYAQENIVPTLQEVEGFEGVYLLVDRQSGKVLTITQWESEEAMRASEEETNRLRSAHRGRWDQVPTEEAGGQEVAGVERYEVAISPERS